MRYTMHPTWQGVEESSYLLNNYMHAAGLESFCDMFAIYGPAQCRDDIDRYIAEARALGVDIVIDYKEPRPRGRYIVEFCHREHGPFYSRLETHKWNVARDFASGLSHEYAFIITNPNGIAVLYN